VNTTHRHYYDGKYGYYEGVEGVHLVVDPCPYALDVEGTREW
jgi:hypothetical protein